MPATIRDAFKERLSEGINDSDVGAFGHVGKVDSALARYKRHGESRLEERFIPARQSTAGISRLHGD
jgi:hypothetical protein